MIGLVRTFVITAYSFGCGATGLTAVTHREPTPYLTAAVDRRVIHGGALLELEHPMLSGSLWYAEDTGDRRVGGLIEGDKIDIMVESCDAARAWGRRKVRVRVVGILPPPGDKHTEAQHRGLGK